MNKKVLLGIIGAVIISILLVISVVLVMIGNKGDDKLVEGDFSKEIVDEVITGDNTEENDVDDNTDYEENSNTDEVSDTGGDTQVSNNIEEDETIYEHGDDSNLDEETANGGEDDGENVGGGVSGNIGTGEQVENEIKGSIDENDFIRFIREEFKLGLTKEEVTKLLGNNYSEVEDVYDGSLLWKYDVGVIDGYEIEDVGYDYVDVDGIYEGKMKGQLYIYWNVEELVSSFSLIHLTEKGTVNDYRVFPDGTHKDQVIME